MILDARVDNRLSGVLIDRGTGKRIPFARWFDAETGQWEALQPAPNGVDIMVDEVGKPHVLKGRAVGKLELIPLDGAHDLLPRKSKKVQGEVKPMDASQKLDGLDQYKKVFLDVWRWRGESKRVSCDRFDEFLTKNNFLDAFVLRRRSG